MHSACANTPARCTAPVKRFLQYKQSFFTRPWATASVRHATRESVARAGLGTYEGRSFLDARRGGDPRRASRRRLTFSLVISIQPAGARGPEHSARASTAPRLQSRCR